MDKSFSDIIIEIAFSAIVIGGVVIAGRWAYFTKQKSEDEKSITHRKEELWKEVCEKKKNDIETSIDNTSKIEECTLKIDNCTSQSCPENIDTPYNFPIPDQATLSSLCEKDDICSAAQKSLESCLQGLSSVKQEYIVLLHLGAGFFIYSQINSQHNNTV